MTEQIPVTVLTGLLGADQKTRQERILTENYGRKLALIINEFDEARIDNDLVTQLHADDTPIRALHRPSCDQWRGKGVGRIWAYVRA